MSLILVSVVRDLQMYSRCISDNPFCVGAELVSYDNSVQNVPITVRYNSFIDSTRDDSDAWIVFCHEDWQPGENLSDFVEKLDRNCIYGPVGVYLAHFPFCDYLVIKGGIIQRSKSGGVGRRFRGSFLSGRVHTLDCQCIIIHSSLLRKCGLRFDEELGFDMYAEEFCVDAFLKAGIVTRAVRMQCTHYSPGVISDGFLKSLEHARSKYRESATRFATIVGYKNCFGGDDTRKVHNLHFKIPFL